jgi:hypothetical protein
MREIKFRAKAITGEWVIGYLVDIGTYAVINSEGEYISCFPDTVGQYTGLKGYDRKDIYEGDIVRHAVSRDKTPYIVEYYADKAAFRIISVKSGTGCCMFVTSKNFFHTLLSATFMKIPILTY